VQYFTQALASCRLKASVVEAITALIAASSLGDSEVEVCVAPAAATETPNEQYK
jgi:hypothetical protein